MITPIDPYTLVYHRIALRGSLLGSFVAFVLRCLVLVSLEVAKSPSSKFLNFKVSYAREFIRRRRFVRSVWMCARVLILFLYGFVRLRVLDLGFGIAFGFDLH